MKDQSLDLHNFLLQQQAEGRQAEAGQFTLHREKALQKIAEFQLPYPESWTLKLAQAAVLSGSEFLTIKQTSSETRFQFLPETWSEDLDFERLFFDPSPHENLCFETIRGALWAVGVGQQKAFSIRLPHQGEGFVWNGSHLEAVESDARASLEIAVSHRSVQDGDGLVILRSIQAASFNSRIKEILINCLYTCPLEISVDGLRIDGYPQCPTHGYRAHRYPMRALGFHLGGLPLRQPPGNASVEKLRECKEQILGLTQDFTFHDVSPESDAIALLTACCGRYSSGDSSSWEVEKVASFLCWVRHGVIIQKEEINVGKHCLALCLHVNADDISTDYSGFALSEDQADPRRQELLRTVSATLQQTEPDFELTDRVWYERRKKAAGATIAVGGVLKLVAGPVGLPVLAAGVVAGFWNSQSIERISNGLIAGYAAMRENWMKEYPLQ